MNFSRKMIFVVGAAFLAACGDKVTVAGPVTPVTPTPKINSVEVAPLTATLNVGQTITMTAAVNADAGLATTVTWSSSDATKASVSTAGVVTAVAATPGVAICAASTVDTGKKGCASVVVKPADAVFPATISIQSITGAGGLNVPVNPNAVAGQIDVTLNVNPGNQVITKVELLVGGLVAGSQTFTAAQSAALRFSADEAVAAQTTFPQIVFSVNTAAYGTTTGIPTWLNGARAVSARLYTTVGGTAQAASASATQTQTFANADGFHVTTTLPTGNVVDGAGYRWNGNGALTVGALPVMYSGTAVGTVNATLGANPSTSLLNTCVGAPAANTAAATTATAGVYSIVVPMTAGQSPAGCTAAWPNMLAITATSAAGDNLVLAATGVLNTQLGWRWDNVAPVAVAGSTFIGVSPNIRLNVNPNGRANAWINDAVVLNAGATSATSNNYLCNASAAGFNTCLAADTLPRDAGVGGTVAYSVQVGATKAAAYAAARVTSAASLAATATNAGYCAIAFAADLLGNKTTLTTAQQATACGTEVNNALIGVDRAAPTIAYTALAIAANARLSGVAIGGEYFVTVNDTGLVGNSGMLPVAPVKMSLSRRAAGATPNSAGTTTLLNATGAGAAITALSATGVAIATPVYGTSFTAVAGAANHAYWTHNATAWDAAGNSASVSPRTMVYDATAPVPGAPTAPLTITALGYTASAFINEDLDIQDYAFNGTYTGAPVLAPVTLGLPWVAVNGYNAATFSNTNFLVSTTVNLPMAIQANMGAGLTNIANLSTVARSQANLAAASGVTAFATVTPGAAILFPAMTAFPAVAGSPALGFGGAVGSGIVTGNATAATAGGAGPLVSSATLTATATGTTAIFNNPFTRIDFYMVDASGLRYILVGSATTPVLTDNGAVRTFTWTASVTGTTLYTTLNGAGATWASNVVALGMNASGRVGMVTAAVNAVNIVF